MKRPAIFMSLIAVGVAIDQATKFIVFGSLQLGTSWPLMKDVMHITPSLNPGVAFSMLRDYPGVVIAISLIAVPLIAWWVWHGWSTATSWLLSAQVLLLIGAVGNLIDRLLPPHHVRDFLDFRPELPLVGHWAVFNVADACICVGVGIYVITEFFGHDKPQDPGDAEKTGELKPKTTEEKLR